MITKNFIRFLNIFSDTDEQFTVNLFITDTTGNDVHWDYSKDSVYTSIRSITSKLFNYTDLANINDDSLSNNTGIFLGSGGGTPSQDDYCLSNPIEFSDDGLSIVKSYCEHNVYKDTFYIHTRIIKNQSSDPITVNECGLFSHIAFTGYNHSPNCKTTFLWARETFDPITIQPGEVRSFVMTISI